jgi:predicted nucleic acid-binding protein
LDRVFLDANVLFSAAYRSESGLRRLWGQPGVRLLTSAYAVEEARRNLPAGERRARLDVLLATVEQVPETETRSLPAGVELPDKDRPILLAALRTGATHLVTGDVTHFGRYLGQTVEGMLICPPAAYLQESAG